jgi:hypothetical protein
MAGLSELAETELREAVLGLGTWHDVESVGSDGFKRKESHFLIKDKEEAQSCLRDAQIALSNESFHTRSAVHFKLGQWHVVQDNLVPLLCAYREDRQLTEPAIDICSTLTQRFDRDSPQFDERVRFLQDHKQALVKKDLFILLQDFIVESLDDDIGEDVEDQKAEEILQSRQVMFDKLFNLFRNILCIPDPHAGDPGFTPKRGNLQVDCLKLMCQEGFMDMLSLLLENQDVLDDEKKAWTMLDILYHMTAILDPELLVSSTARSKKHVLKESLGKSLLAEKLSMSTSSRHSRFGTMMIKQDSITGIQQMSSSLSGIASNAKGNRVMSREFKDRAGSDRKLNMFHNPFFIDLEEGQVREHSALNIHLKTTGQRQDLPAETLEALKKFFEEFTTSFASGFISKLVRTVGNGREPGKEYNRPRLMNFVAWCLEFHRHLFYTRCKDAKQVKQPKPIIDVRAVQGELDLDMLQFVTARLREYGKESQIHSSHLTIVLRCLCQQLKTIAEVIKCEDADTRNVSLVLTQNIVREGVMDHLAWIMKNYKSSSHDPRILSYSVEIFHMLHRLMAQVRKENGEEDAAFAVQKPGRSGKLGKTTVDQEIRKLADARVIDNLFHLLEKYRLHTPVLRSMLVKLIYDIIKAQPTNIVVFFELTYFLRIHRIVNDPHVKDRRTGKPYEEMVELLRYILRQFFKCAEKNGCSFVELLFRKMQESSRDALLESHTAEWAAILDNYENAEYKEGVLDKLDEGETVESLRTRQQVMRKGDLPWTEKENDHLRTKFWVYCDHPLAADLIAAELPPENNRTGRQVKKQLQELGLFDERARRAKEGDARTGEDSRAHTKEQSQSQKDSELFDAVFGNEKLELEKELEEFLDEAMRNGKEPAGKAPAPGEEAGFNLDKELEKVMEQGREAPAPTQLESSSVDPLFEQDPLETAPPKPDPFMAEETLKQDWDCSPPKDLPNGSQHFDDLAGFGISAVKEKASITTDENLTQDWDCSPQQDLPDGSQAYAELADFGIPQVKSAANSLSQDFDDSMEGFDTPAAAPSQKRTSATQHTDSGSLADPATVASPRKDDSMESSTEAPPRKKRIVATPQHGSCTAGEADLVRNVGFSGLQASPSNFSPGDKLSQPLEKCLEAVMESMDMDLALGSQDAASQLPSQGLSQGLEAELARVMDEVDASQLGKTLSQDEPLDLTAELERLLEEGSQLS